MTPDQITRNLYTWLTHASRIDGMPIGFRPCTWDQLQALDPTLAQTWRDAVMAFIVVLGTDVPQDDDDHLNFVGKLVLEEDPVPLLEDEGNEHRITPDDG